MGGRDNEQINFKILKCNLHFISIEEPTATYNLFGRNRKN